MNKTNLIPLDETPMFSVQNFLPRVGEEVFMAHKLYEVFAITHVIRENGKMESDVYLRPKNKTT